MSRSKVKPRLIQLPQLLEYLGISKPVFNKTLRNKLKPIQLGHRTIMYEMDEVDRIIDSIKKGETPCHTDYIKEGSTTTLTPPIVEENCVSPLDVSSCPQP